MNFQFVRIKINQPVPPGSPVVSIIVTNEGLAAVLGRHGVGPGGAGWIESQPMPVAAALDAAKTELLQPPVLRWPVALAGPEVIFVYFYSDDQWDPSWGKWSWLRRSGAPIPESHGKKGWRRRA